MDKSESIKELAAALSAAQAEMPPAPFNAKANYGRYADLGSVIDTARPVLAKHGLSISQLVIGSGAEVGVKTVLMHTSGEWIESVVAIPLDTQKANLAQAAGAVISYLRRYSLSAILGMYADEDTDADHPAKTENRAEPKGNGNKNPLAVSFDANLPEMGLATAMAVQNSKGIPYGQIPSSELVMMVKGIEKGMQTHPEKLEEYQYKLTAIQTILRDRAGK